MLKAKYMFMIVAFAAAMFFTAGASSAQTTAIVTDKGNCLIPGGDRAIYVFKCTDGGIRYNIRDGRIRTSDNLCFDHGVVRGSNPSNAQRHVKLVGCHGGQSQVWYIIGSGRGVGLIQNAVNPDVCLNIEGGNDSPGTRVLVWGCGFNGPAANERFYIGGALTRTQMNNVPSGALSVVNRGGSVTFSNGAKLVAAGGGNLVAAGAGNLVAAGAGNLVAAGGGNVVPTGGGSLVAAGGGNLAAKLVGNDGSTMRSMTFRPN